MELESDIFKNERGIVTWVRGAGGESVSVMTKEGVSLFAKKAGENYSKPSESVSEEKRGGIHTGSIDLSGVSFDLKGQARVIWMSTVMQNLLGLAAELMQLPDADARARAVWKLSELVNSLGDFTKDSRSKYEKGTARQIDFY